MTQHAINKTAFDENNFLSVMIGNHARIGKTLLGGIVILLVWQLVAAFFVLNAPAVQALVAGRGMGKPLSDTLSSAAEATTALSIMIGGFGPAFLLLIIWRRFVEKRAIKTLFTAAPAFRWSLCFASFGYVAVFGAALPLLLDPTGAAPFSARMARFSANDWAMLTIVYFLGVCVQASFEEVFVRGWMMQHLKRRIRNSFALVIVTALIFMALHAGYSGYATYVITFSLGISFAWSVVRLGGLEAAIGAHVGNNLFSALLMGTLVSGNPSTLQATDFAFYAIYILGFLGFVEGWARWRGSSLRPAADRLEGA